MTASALQKDSGTGYHPPYCKDVDEQKDLCLVPHTADLKDPGDDGCRKAAEPDPAFCRSRFFTVNEFSNQYDQYCCNGKPYLAEIVGEADNSHIRIRHYVGKQGAYPFGPCGGKRSPRGGRIVTIRCISLRYCICSVHG